MKQLLNLCLRILFVGWMIERRKLSRADAQEGSFALGIFDSLICLSVEFLHTVAPLMCVLAFVRDTVIPQANTGTKRMVLTGVETKLRIICKSESPEICRPLTERFTSSNMG
jgi:hypothetical protein